MPHNRFANMAHSGDDGVSETHETKAVVRRRERRRNTAPGRPRSLTRDAVIAGAVEIIMHSPGSALSLRALGRKLGVSAPTLYTYFDQIEDIEAAALDQIVGTVPFLDLDSPRPVAEQLIDQCVALREIEVHYPGVIPGRIGSVPWRWSIRRANQLLKTLAALGVEPFAASVAYQVLVGATMMYAADIRANGCGEVGAYRSEVIDTLDPGDVDAIKSLRQQRSGTSESPSGGFREFLRTLIEIHLPEVIQYDASARRVQARNPPPARTVKKNKKR
jgi:AcrR family transcriptional regulator